MLSLTQQERQVILFIFTVAIAGLGINYFLKIQRQPQLLPCFDKNLGKIDINEVDASGLLKLPGVGEKLTSRILEYRRQNAGFQQVEELRNIKGITASRFNRLKDLFFVQD
jgi:competence ComEA-like helix-hairpin-helix protein